MYSTFGPCLPAVKTSGGRTIRATQPKPWGAGKKSELKREEGGTLESQQHDGPGVPKRESDDTAGVMWTPWDAVAAAERTSVPGELCLSRYRLSLAAWAGTRLRLSIPVPETGGRTTACGQCRALQSKLRAPPRRAYRRYRPGYRYQRQRPAAHLCCTTVHQGRQADLAASASAHAT